MYFTREEALISDYFHFKLLDADWIDHVFSPCCVTVGQNPLIVSLSKGKHLSQLASSHTNTPHIIVAAQYRGAHEICQDKA